MRGSWRGGAATRPRSRAARGREDELLAQLGVEETVQGVRRGRYCRVSLLVVTKERISHKDSKLFCLGDKQTSAGGGWREGGRSSFEGGASRSFQGGETPRHQGLLS